MGWVTKKGESNCCLLLSDKARGKQKTYYDCRCDERLQGKSLRDLQGELTF
jgi:hypothetical protein